MLEKEQRSKLLRRSGIAVALICEHIGWQPDCFYQIGIGMLHGELDVITQVWDDVEIHGCEPHPQILSGLRGKYPGTLYETAVSDYIGEAILYSKPRHKDGSSLYPHTTCEGGDSFPVKVTTVDTLWPDGPHGLHPMLWVDCEGSELPVLRGGEKFISAVDVINIELTGKQMGIGWSKQEEVHTWLLDHGFRRQWVHTQRAFVGQCDGIYVRPAIFNPDICCCPCELLRGEKCRTV